MGARKRQQLCSNTLATVFRDYGKSVQIKGPRRVELLQGLEQVMSIHGEQGIRWVRGLIVNRIRIETGDHLLLARHDPAILIRLRCSNEKEAAFNDLMRWHANYGALVQSVEKPVARHNDKLCYSRDVICGCWPQFNFCHG